jgi:hypothetical protein
MKKKIMGFSILVTLLFIATTFSGAANISQFHSTSNTLIPNKSPESLQLPNDDPSSAIMAIGIFRLGINPSISEISGLGLPEKEGKFPVRIISNLQWTTSSLGSMILFFNPLTLKFETYSGSTSGHMMLFIGSVEIKERLIGATDYVFKGIAYSLEIIK